MEPSAEVKELMPRFVQVHASLGVASEAVLQPTQASVGLALKVCNSRKRRNGNDE
jgi:hypothetical protein